jgi:hypothetical protein
MGGTVDFIYARSAYTVIRSGCLCHWRSRRDLACFVLVAFDLACPVHKGEKPDGYSH